MTDIDPLTLRSLLGDRSGLRRILVNLANNAIKFPEQGAVELQAIFARIHGALRVGLTCAITSGATVICHFIEAPAVDDIRGYRKS